MEAYAAEVGVDVSLQTVEIETVEDVQRHRFIGSPTVRIGGLDVDPRARSVTRYGFT